MNWNVYFQGVAIVAGLIAFTALLMGWIYLLIHLSADKEKPILAGIIFVGTLLFGLPLLVAWAA